MKNRAIHLFPEFEGIELIEDIRARFDPLYSKIEPHITLVFPFSSDINTVELEACIREVISGERVFEIELQNICAVESYGYYLYLNINKGREFILNLHNRLYSGQLQRIKPDWLETNPYNPHMTVGKLNSRELMTEAEGFCSTLTRSFKSVISRVIVEEIDEDENSIVELEISFS